MTEEEIRQLKEENEALWDRVRKAESLLCGFGWNPRKRDYEDDEADDIPF